MSNTEFRKKMITALEAMQKSCSDMCDILKDEAGRNMELPQGTDPSPARRMWKRWVKPLKDGDICDALWKDHEKDRGRDPGSRIPVTILPGHSAVEEIEKDAYYRGYLSGKDSEIARYSVEEIEREAYERGRRDTLDCGSVAQYGRSEYERGKRDAMSSRPMFCDLERVER